MGTNGLRNPVPCEIQLVSLLLKGTYKKMNSKYTQSYSALPMLLRHKPMKFSPPFLLIENVETITDCILPWDSWSFPANSIRVRWKPPYQVTHISHNVKSLSGQKKNLYPLQVKEKWKFQKLSSYFDDFQCEIINAKTNSPGLSLFLQIHMWSPEHTQLSILATVLYF